MAWQDQGGNMVYVPSASGGQGNSGSGFTTGPTVPSSPPPGADAGAATLPLAQALANAQQEERPGSSSMSLVAYLNRRIASLERRMSDLEQ